MLRSSPPSVMARSSFVRTVSRLMRVRLSTSISVEVLVMVPKSITDRSNTPAVSYKGLGHRHFGSFFVMLIQHTPVRYCPCERAAV